MLVLVPRLRLELSALRLKVGCRRPDDPRGEHVTCVGVEGLEPPASSSRTTRATKLRHTP